MEAHAFQLNSLAIEDEALLRIKFEGTKARLERNHVPILQADNDRIKRRRTLHLPQLRFVNAQLQGEIAL